MKQKYRRSTLGYYGMGDRLTQPKSASAGVWKHLPCEQSRAKLASGPFAEFAATVEKISPDQRVWVLLDLMDRTTRVAVQTEALQVV